MSGATMNGNASANAAGSRNAHDEEEATILYVLKLESSKCYVGSTNNLDRRFAEHLGGTGSAWTAKCSPLEVVHQQPGSCFFEDATVLMCMSRFGINHVRGGTCSQIHLSRDHRKHIKEQLRHANNLCFNCGSSRHFANKSPLLTNSGGNKAEEEEQEQHRNVNDNRCPPAATSQQQQLQNLRMKQAERWRQRSSSEQQ